MRKYFLLPFIAFFIVGCSPEVSTNQASTTVQKESVKLISMEEVKQKLDKHILSDEDKPYYQILGAFDGLKVTVDDNYRLEIYIFKNNQALALAQENLGTADSLLWELDDLLFLLHTTDKSKLDKLKSDFSE